jgi:hypothetical protein
VWRTYISDTESGKVFVTAVGDNVHKMPAFEDINRMKDTPHGVIDFTVDLS